MPSTTHSSLYTFRDGFVRLGGAMFFAAVVLDAPALTLAQAPAANASSCDASRSKSMLSAALAHSEPLQQRMPDPFRQGSVM
jgi:hypothetical protein